MQPGGDQEPPGGLVFFNDGDQQRARNSIARKLSRVMVMITGVAIAILTVVLAVSDVVTHALASPSKKPSTIFPLVRSPVVGRMATSGSLSISLVFLCLLIIFFAVLGVAIWMCKKRWQEAESGKAKQKVVYGTKGLRD